MAELPTNQLLDQAEHGDLRPQFNRRAAITWPAGLDPAPVVPLLLKRFFELSRPIADACHEPGLNMRLGDCGRFIYLVEALRRVGYRRVEDELLMLLDEFCQLEQRSYDELYLWCIVELSRLHLEYVQRFWPLALTLDLSFRAKPWQRPAGATVFEQPYRLIELIMFYYVIGTQPASRDRYALTGRPVGASARAASYPSLLACLRGCSLGLDQTKLLLEALAELARQERRPAFGDALGSLTRRP